MKKIVILTLVLLLLPVAVLAADELTFDGSTNISIGSVTYVVSADSVCDQMVVGASTVVFTLSRNSNVTITSSDRKDFNESTTAYGGTVCGDSQSSINLLGQSLGASDTADVTLTPSGTCEASTASGGGGGGGGGGAPIITTPTKPSTTTGQVTATAASGGETTVTTDDNSSAAANLPVNAVSANTAVTISPVAKGTVTESRPTPSGRQVVGGYAYNYTATSNGSAITDFARSVTLTFTYTDAQISGLNESTLKVYYWQESSSQWIALSTVVDADNNLLTAATDHFTYFAIFGAEEGAAEGEVVVETTATGIVDGDLIQNPDAEGDAKFDIYIVKLVGSKKFKRLILSPHVFESYGHLSWNNVKTVNQTTMNQYTVSDLARCVDPQYGIDDPKVYRLVASGDTGSKQHMNMSAAEFEAQGNDWDSIYIINKVDRDAYNLGESISTGGTVSSTQQVKILASTLRVRSLPSLNGEAVTTVGTGEVYDLIEEQAGWYKITANGVTGWCYGGDTGGYAAKQ